MKENINYDTWKKMVLSAVEKIADKSYQEKAWFGLDDNLFSSPEEVYCVLFDDALFDEFLLFDKFHLTNKQRELGLLLQLKLNDFSDKYMLGDFSDPEIIFNHYEWKKIRDIAQEFLNSFGGNRGR